MRDGLKAGAPGHINRCSFRGLEKVNNRVEGRREDHRKVLPPASQEYTQDKPPKKQFFDPRNHDGGQGRASERTPGDRGPYRVYMDSDQCSAAQREQQQSNEETANEMSPPLRI